MPHYITEEAIAHRYQQVRSINKLISAIKNCPGTVWLGATLVKSGNEKTMYINQQRIAKLVERRLHGPPLHAAA